MGLGKGESGAWGGGLGRMGSGRTGSGRMNSERTDSGRSRGRGVWRWTRNEFGRNLDSHVSQQRRFLSSRASSRAGSPLRHAVPAPALAAEAQAHLDLIPLLLPLLLPEALLLLLLRHRSLVLLVSVMVPLHVSLGWYLYRHTSWRRPARIRGIRPRRTRQRHGATALVRW